MVAVALFNVPKPDNSSDVTPLVRNKQAVVQLERHSRRRRGVADARVTGQIADGGDQTRSMQPTTPHLVSIFQERQRQRDRKQAGLCRAGAGRGLTARRRGARASSVSCSRRWRHGAI